MARRGTKANPFVVGEVVVLAADDIDLVRRHISSVGSVKVHGDSGKVIKRIGYKLLCANGEKSKVYLADELVSVRDRAKEIKIERHVEFDHLRRAFRQYILDTLPKHAGVNTERAEAIMRDYLLDEVIEDFTLEYYE